MKRTLAMIVIIVATASVVEAMPAGWYLNEVDASIEGATWEQVNTYIKRQGVYHAEITGAQFVATYNRLQEAIIKGVRENYTMRIGRLIYAEVVSFEQSIIYHVILYNDGDSRGIRSWLWKQQ
ncbi:hypothetical protein FACS189461_3290 [Spirochaetia bacterium]|nr:hypothetical protein FACS189461_3290 [Spirochaetia bacterium]